MENWNILRTTYKVADFLSWQKSGQLQLSPSFQRRPVWSKSMKSYFIDTIVRDLPIPIIFIRDQTNPDTFETIRLVVDGQQRLRTVLSFIEPDCLKDLNEDRDIFRVKKIHNEEIGDKDFKELPKNVKQRILDYPFSVHVLPSNISDPLVLQIFSRMNSTGVKLNAQELRNANYFGEFKQIIYGLALEQLDRWRKWNIFTEDNIARMNEVEATSDLVLLIINGISTKDKISLDNLYKKYDEVFPEKVIVMNRFRIVMDSIEDSIGFDIKKLNFSKETIFYYLFVLIYDIQFVLNSKLIDTKSNKLPIDFKNKVIKINDFFEESKYPIEIFKSATRRSVASVRKLIYEYLKAFI